MRAPLKPAFEKRQMPTDRVTATIPGKILNEGVEPTFVYHEGPTYNTTYFRPKEQNKNQVPSLQKATAPPLPTTARPMSRPVKIEKLYNYSEPELTGLQKARRRTCSAGRGCLTGVKNFKNMYVESREYLDMFVAVLKFVVFVVLVVCFLKLYRYAMGLKANLMSVAGALSDTEAELQKISVAIKTLVGGLANGANGIASSAQNALSSL